MADHDQVDDVWALDDALRAYGTRYMRRYGLEWAVNHFGVQPTELCEWTAGERASPSGLQRVARTWY